MEEKSVSENTEKVSRKEKFLRRGGESILGNCNIGQNRIRGCKYEHPL